MTMGNKRNNNTATCCTLSAADAYEDAAVIAENCSQDDAARDEPFRIAQTIREHARLRLTAAPPAPDEADKALAQDDDKRVRDLLRECEQRTGIDLASDSWPNDLVDRVKGYGAAIKRAAYLQAARDVCCYCGGRATAFFSSVDGPNKAANFTHQHRTDKDAQALCKASAIYMRLESASKQER